MVFQTKPVALMMPAIPGSIPAMVVRKNIKKEPISEYAIESPAEAAPYPSFSLIVSLFMV